MHITSKGWFDPSDGSVDFRNWSEGNAALADPGGKWPSGDPKGVSDAASGWAPGTSSGSTPMQTASTGDLGTISSLASGGSGGSSTASGAAGAAPAPTVIKTAGSGLVIDLMWDSSVSSAPAGFVSDMIAAAQFLESQISTTATINLDVGYNEIAGNTLESGALGESQSNIESVNYASLVAALKASASTDPTDASVLASLPATSPVSGTYWITTAQAKALGLAPANGTGLDGAVGFGSSSEFTYGDTNTAGTVAAGTYDMFATAVHEITETMGRLLLVGESISGSAGYSLMDLLHYSASGTRDFVQSTPGYFSVNGASAILRRSTAADVSTTPVLQTQAFG